MRGILFLVVIATTASCGDDPTTTIKCGSGTSGTLTADKAVEVTSDAGSDLRGAKIAAGPGTTIRVVASGPEAEAVLDALDHLVATHFGEEE